MREDKLMNSVYSPCEPSQCFPPLDVETESPRAIIQRGFLTDQVGNSQGAKAFSCL